MNHEAATAYLCVAHRIVFYKKHHDDAEYFEVVLKILYDYSEQEIIMVYQSDIKFTAEQALMNKVGIILSI